MKWNAPRSVFGAGQDPLRPVRRQGAAPAALHRRLRTARWSDSIELHRAQSSLMPACRISVPHLRCSARMKSANCRGVPPIGVLPSESNLFCTSGVFNTFCISALMRSTTACGVPAGATRPVQVMASKPGWPASATVGTAASSGTLCTRCAELTAKARTRLPASCAMAGAGLAKLRSTRLPSQSGLAGPAPLYRTLSISKSARRLSISPARWPTVPLPASPMRSDSGLARDAWTTSASVLSTETALTSSTTGWDAMLVIGAKTCNGSKGIFGESAGVIARLAVWPRPIVWPSATALAGGWRPRLPPAPGGLSIPRVQPACVASLSASKRAIVSVPPPGGNGTTSLIGLAGQTSWANQAPASGASKAAAAKARRRIASFRFFMLTRSCSLGLEVGALDHLPPCAFVGDEKVVEPGRRAAHRLQTVLHQASGNPGHGENLGDLALYALDGGRRRVPGGADARPGHRLELGDAGFHHGGHLGECGQALRAGDGQRPQLARARVLHRADGLIEDHRHRALQHIRHGLACAFVGNVNDVDTGARLEHLTGQMAARAGAGRGKVEFARPVPGVGDQFLHSADRQPGIDHQHIGRIDDLRDRHEVFFRIEGHALDQVGLYRQGSGRAHQERVAVGRGPQQCGHRQLSPPPPPPLSPRPCPAPPPLRPVWALSGAPRCHWSRPVKSPRECAPVCRGTHPQPAPARKAFPRLARPRPRPRTGFEEKPDVACEFPCCRQ